MFTKSKSKGKVIVTAAMLPCVWIDADNPCKGYAPIFEHEYQLFRPTDVVMHVWHVLATPIGPGNPTVYHVKVNGTLPTMTEALAAELQVMADLSEQGYTVIER